MTQRVGTHDARARRRWRTISGSVALALTFVLALGLWAQAASVIGHGPRHKPWVALTFDDGWNIDRCARIVRTLRAKRAPATFFINGGLMKRDPPRWRRLLRGFEVANHTLSHKDLSRLEAAAIRSQVVLNERVIERILGRPMLRLLRPSYGAYDPEVLRIAAALGYHTVLWDTDSGDARAGSTTRSIVANGSRGRDGAIVLLHCGPSATPAAVGRIIERYRERGFRLVRLGTMLDLDPPASACGVVNDRSGRAERSLQEAARRAKSGDRLLLRGTCLGPTRIRKDLEIIGTEAEVAGRPTLDGVGRGTVVTVAPGATVTLRGLTIRAGLRGILNKGRLTLDGVVVQGNGVEEIGAGVYNAIGAALILRGSSTIRGNTASMAGGGILNAGTLLLRDSSSIVRNVIRDDDPASSDVTGDGGPLSSPSPMLRGPGGGILDVGIVDGAVCGPTPGANIHGNGPDDCRSVTHAGPTVVPVD